MTKYLQDVRTTNEASWVVWANSQFATVWGVFFSLFCGLLGKATCRTVRQIWTNEGSKRVVPLKEVPIGGLNDVRLNFGGVNRTFKPEREKNSNPYNLKTT